MKKILIVGGVAGGATAATRLRRLNEKDSIIMFEKGKHISFANCGLPYHIGGVIHRREDLLLQTPESFRSRYNIDVRVNSEVLSINPISKKISVKNLLTLEQYDETYDKLILAPGAAPIVPAMEGSTLDNVLTLRNIDDMDRIKQYINLNNAKSAAIVGGGFIGLEMAENLKKAGLKVSIIEMSKQLMAVLDPEMAEDVHRYIEQTGITLYLGNGLSKIEKNENKLKITLSNGTLEEDMLILAIGVRPETAFIKDSGLSLNERGGIIVNKYMQTSDPDIFAVGDAVQVNDFISGKPVMVPLAGPANKQARIAADNINGIPSEYKGSQGSAIIKIFDMTAAVTGLNEKTASSLNLNYDKIYLWLNDHAGYYPGSKPMSIKVIFDKENGKILGAQIVGFKGVDKRCDVLAVAIRAGMTAKELKELELCYSPPFSSAKDPVNMAAYVIENVMTGKIRNFHWHDVDSLPRDDSVILLDVREKLEYEEGHIEGFINIALDNLREAINGLDKKKTVYVNCHSGIRSYTAARILSQNGFNVFNLSGGYRLYKAARLRI